MIPNSQTLTASSALDFIIDLFQNTQTGDLNYFYRGFFSAGITDNILQLTERNIAQGEGSTAIRKRVYYLMVESLQNITRYQAREAEHIGFFMMKKKSGHYYITTGNYIENERVGYVRQQLDNVNRLSHDELRNYYRKILDNKHFTKEGGAGLGLIELARKSRHKLASEFVRIDDKFSYFYLHMDIPAKRKKDLEGKPIPESENLATMTKNLKQIVRIHQFLKKQRLVLLFNTGFRQDNLTHILNVIHKQIANVHHLKEHVTALMKILQQVSPRRTNGKEEKKQEHGIFFIDDSPEGLKLNVGNCIDNKELEIFKEKLIDVDGIKRQTKTNETLSLEMTTGSDELGIINLKLKPKNQLEFLFHRLNEKHSFFVLSITVENNAHKKNNLL